MSLVFTHWHSPEKLPHNRLNDNGAFRCSRPSSCGSLSTGEMGDERTRRGWRPSSSDPCHHATIKSFSHPALPSLIRYLLGRDGRCGKSARSTVSRARRPALRELPPGPLAPVLLSAIITLIAPCSCARSGYRLQCSSRSSIHVGLTLVEQPPISENELLRHLAPLPAPFSPPRPPASNCRRTTILHRNAYKIPPNCTMSR
jgi:hypothetical protein